MPKTAPLEIERFWEWVIEPDACEFCQSMEGTIHPIDEPMDTHPNCRCTMNILEKAYTLEDLIDNSLPLELQMREADRIAEFAARLREEAERIKKQTELRNLQAEVPSLLRGTTVRRLADEVDKFGNVVQVFETSNGGKLRLYGHDILPKLSTAQVEEQILSTRLLLGQEVANVPLLPSGVGQSLAVERVTSVSELNKATAAIKRIAIAGARFDSEFRSEIVEAAIEAGATNFTAEHFNVVKSLGDVPAKYWLQKSITNNWDITEMRKQVKQYKQNIKKLK